jgi:hypothetical protein
MKKRINIDWKNHFIELIVVFIGISLAFALDNWREDINNRKLEKQYIGSFYKDISDDASSLEEIMRISKVKVDRIERYINRLKYHTTVQDSALIIIQDIMTKTPFSPKLSTYESIKSSGNLNILSDYKLKHDIIGYYQSLIDMKMKEDVYNNYIDQFAIPFVYENLDFLNQKLIKKNVLTSKRFNNLIFGYYALLTQNLKTYKNIYNKTQDLKTQISFLNKTE